LTDAVPARVTLYSDTRRRSIQLDKLVIEFKLAAPSRLYWAGRPAMRVVQALHWLKDMMPTEGNRIRKTLARILSDSKLGEALRDDLAQGFGVLPGWMQAFLRTVLGFDPANTAHGPVAQPVIPSRPITPSPARRRKLLSS
jgi:hypothetical protein